MNDQTILESLQAIIKTLNNARDQFQLAEKGQKTMNGFFSRDFTRKMPPISNYLTLVKSNVEQAYTSFRHLEHRILTSLPFSGRTRAQVELITTLLKQCRTAYSNIERTIAQLYILKDKMRS